VDHTSLYPYEPFERNGYCITADYEATTAENCNQTISGSLTTGPRAHVELGAPIPKLAPPHCPPVLSPVAYQRGGASGSVSERLCMNALGRAVHRQPADQSQGRKQGVTEDGGARGVTMAMAFHRSSAVVMLRPRLSRSGFSFASQRSVLLC
jgi:hypothetical protein